MHLTQYLMGIAIQLSSLFTLLNKWTKRTHSFWESTVTTDYLMSILPRGFFTKGDLDWPVAETIPEQTAGIWGTVSMGLKKDSFTMGLPKNCCI